MKNKNDSSESKGWLIIVAVVALVGLYVLFKFIAAVFGFILNNTPLVVILSIVISAIVALVVFFRK